jgi:AbrB family looped-hinge helix DNA binding protein
MPELYNAKVIENRALLVPIEIVEKLNLQEGDEVEFSVNDAGFIEVKPVASALNPVLELAGKYSKAFKNFDLAKEREGWVRSWEK